MTTGAIIPSMLALAWPLVAGNLLQTVYYIVDIFWVGRVSSEAVAGVSLMFPLAWMFVSTGLGLTAATIALVSQHVGADNIRHADRVVSQSILLALAVATVLASLGWIFRTQILSLMGAEGQVFVEALQYIEVILFALPFTFLFFAFRASLQGAGDTKTAMWLMVISAGINVVLDPLLILGWGPFPAWGTRGAAWATFLARGSATAAGIIILLRGGFGVTLHPGDLRPDRSILTELVSIGYPASIDGWARSFAAVVMAAFVAPFGTAVIAAYGIGVRLMSVSWSVAGAVGQATATGVGQNLGAQTPDRAARLTWLSTGGTMGLLILAAGVCVLFPEIAVGIFIDDPAVIEEGRIFLWIVAPFWAFFGGTMVLQGALQGAGRTKAAMVLSFLSRWVFRVPIALLLAFSITIPLPIVPYTLQTFGIGVTGIWFGYATGAFVTFLIAVVWFRRGTWREGIPTTDSLHRAPEDPTPTTE